MHVCIGIKAAGAVVLDLNLAEHLIRQTLSIKHAAACTFGAAAGLLEHAHVLSLDSPQAGHRADFIMFDCGLNNI